MLNETIYIGSIVPSRLSEDMLRKVEKCGYQIGKLLYMKGYNGLLGVDAMITEEDVFIPIIEINARFTLSTYVSFLLAKYRKIKMLSFYQRIPLAEKDNYQTILKKMKEKTGAIQGFCYVSETLNEETVGQYGRLFMFVFGEKVDQILELRNRILEC